jgi:hypothetical protein
MSDLGPLSGKERKLAFAGVRAVIDVQTSGTCHRSGDLGTV